MFLGGVLAAVLGPLWELSTFEKASLIGSVFLGMFIGALTLGRLADRVGRKKMFLINLGIYLVFSLLAAFSPNVWILIACRFIAGVGAGAEAALIPHLPRRIHPPATAAAATSATRSPSPSSPTPSSPSPAHPWRKRTS